MKKRCAVIGMGLLGSQHAERLNKHSTTKVVAVCDIKPDKAKAWADANGANCYSDYEQMFNNEAIDILVVATQDPYHKEPLLAACAHKIPYVISEKPLTTNLSDAMEIKAAAEKSGTVIKVLFPNRLYPIDHSIRLLIEKGFIGKPEYGEFRIDDSIDVPLKLWGKDSKNYAAISSPAYFLFSHAVDLLLFMFGRKVEKVYAVGKKSVIGSDVDYMDCFLTFEGGFTARLKTEWTKRIDRLCENYLQFTATKGGFIFNKTGGFQCEQGLSFVIDEGEEKAKEAQALLAKYGYTSVVEKCGESGAYALVMREADKGNAFDWNEGVCVYADSFENPEPELSPLTSLEGGIEQVRIVEALLVSAKEGREITL
jgi:predicted dehydrogenase